MRPYLILLLFVLGCASTKLNQPMKQMLATKTMANRKDLGPKVSQKAVTLAWDASQDPSVVGYRIYYGAGSRSYTNTVECGSSNTVSVPLYATRTYFAATCYTSVGLESDYSTEVVYDTSTILTVNAEWSTNVSGPWSPVPGFIPITVTNPVGSAFFRLNIH